MRVPQLVSDFFAWRWSPCVGLTAGSLTFVLLALLLIPSQVGEPPPRKDVLGAFEPPARRALFGASLAQETRDIGPGLAAETTAPRARQRPVDPVSPAPQRGFSPIADREPPPVPPVPPVPAVPPAPAAPPELPAPRPLADVGAGLAPQPEPAGPQREATSP